MPEVDLARKCLAPHQWGHRTSAFLSKNRPHANARRGELVPARRWPGRGPHHRAPPAGPDEGHHHQRGRPRLHRPAPVRPRVNVSSARAHRAAHRVHRRAVGWKSEVTVQDLLDEIRERPGTGDLIPSSTRLRRNKSPSSGIAAQTLSMTPSNARRRHSRRESGTDCRA